MESHSSSFWKPTPSGSAMLTRVDSVMLMPRVWLDWAGSNAVDK